jgi:hypothetical protein
MFTTSMRSFQSLSHTAQSVRERLVFSTGWRVVSRSSFHLTVALRQFYRFYLKRLVASDKIGSELEMCGTMARIRILSGPELTLGSRSRPKLKHLLVAGLKIVVKSSVLFNEI